MTGPTVVPLVDDGLGNSAYLVDLGDGRALVVDASRDLRAVRDRRGRARAAVAYAADTHLHADFLSGARQLAATEGATVLASAAGAREFAHSGLATATRSTSAGCACGPWPPRGTPTSTCRSCSWTATEPVGVFTGGSLIVGAAARTDLVDPSAPRSWPAPSTARCTGCSACPTTSPCGPPTARARSAPRRPAPSGPAPSDGRRPPTRCCEPPTRTRS